MLANMTIISLFLMLSGEVPKKPEKEVPTRGWNVRSCGRGATSSASEPTASESCGPEPPELKEHQSLPTVYNGVSTHDLACIIADQRWYLSTPAEERLPMQLVE